jgi:hypothetical protein
MSIDADSDGLPSNITRVQYISISTLKLSNPFTIGEVIHYLMNLVNTGIPHDKIAKQEPPKYKMTVNLGKSEQSTRR